MGLNNYKLGDLIEQCDDRNADNTYSLSDVKGISIQKIFIETKANMDGVSLNPYILVKPDFFAYVTVTSRNGEKITLAHNTTENTYIVSSTYVVFEIKRNDLISSAYLFMYFNRPEFDRFSRFNSWGSARETFSWEDLCDIDLELPDIKVQQKYVDIYNAMLSNQKCYERGLDDLKLVCDSYIEDLRRTMTCKPIGEYIKLVNTTNDEKKYTCVQGVESSGSFIDTRANMKGVDIEKYTVVSKDNIAYNPSRINIGSIALYSNDEPCVVSPMYLVFEIINIKKVLPKYLMLWFSRKEFQRYTWFYSAGSVRDTFDFNLLKEVEFPIPTIEIQKDIVNIYTVYKERKSINEKLKTQIKDICPILIKGSLEEYKKTKEK